MFFTRFKKKIVKVIENTGKRNYILERKCRADKTYLKLIQRRLKLVSIAFFVDKKADNICLFNNVIGIIYAV